MARLVCLLSTCLLAGFLQSQTSIERDQYIVNRPPDSLFLYNIIAKDTIAISYRVDPQDSARYRQVVAGLGSWTIKENESRQPVLESIQLASGWEYRFQAPLALLPATLKTWQTFSVQAEFVAYYRGARRGKGLFQMEINMQNKDSARTPLRNFSDCIVLTTKANTQGNGFPPLSYELKEWYAREMGLVKLAGSYTTGPNAQTLKIASNLVWAKLQGKELKGRN